MAAVAISLLVHGTTRLSKSLAAQACEPVPVGNLLAGRDIIYDADGLIVHEPTFAGDNPHPCGDGGDTAQREGWYWLGVWIRENTPGLNPWTKPRALTFSQVLELLEPHRDGVFYRHPKLYPWNNPRGKEFGFSRDQMVPLVAAMGVWGRQAELRRLWDALPEDALGKHTFNGNWRNLLGQDGTDCDAIKKRGCDATRDCSLKTDTRDCSLKIDTRDCPLQEDTRSCSTCIVPNPFGGCILYGNDLSCEIAKAAQNAIYKANKDACEVAKATQNVIYAGEKAACESAKAAQNAIYVAEKDACEVAKAAEKAACEVGKTVDLNLCRLTNVHSGDFIGPMTENLFSRAMNESLSHSLGEQELLVNTILRISEATDKDNTGDDLNLIVMLLMSKLRSPTPESEASVALYAGLRPFSYGSYLDTYRAMYPSDHATYRATYGYDTSEMKLRIASGIANGWNADAPPVIGAVHWYHRPETRGNPQLAGLYDPIINRFIYGDLTGTFSTPATRNPAPTLTTVTPFGGPPDGGTTVTITGTNFIPGTTVLIGGAQALDVNVVNSTRLAAVTPPQEAGIVSVSVTVPWPGGGTATKANGFVYEGPRALILPANIAAEATGASGAVVAFEAASTDPVDGALRTTCVPASHTPFPIGITLVSCSAVNSRGASATKTFTVTVSDTTPPALVHSGDIVAEATRSTGALVSFDLSASDLVDGARPVQCAPLARSTFPLGQTQVNCASSDVTGNRATSSFLVTVVDTTPPVLVVPARIDVMSTEATPVRAVYSVTASDLVDTVPQILCTPASGSVFAVGSTTVSCSATDRAGNLATRTFPVVVSLAISSPDGRMFGNGHIDSTGIHHHFVFRVWQRQTIDYGRLEYWENSPQRCQTSDHDDHGASADDDRSYDRHHRQRSNVFAATTIDEVRFSDDPAFRPTRLVSRRRPIVDTVTISGTGIWNGATGYSFEAIATDRGEPGRGRDTLSLVVKDPAGSVIATVSGSLDGGNIQSLRLKLHHSRR